MVLRLTLFNLFFASLLWQELTATKISGVEDEPTGTWNLTSTDALRRALLPGYDRLVRPANADEATPVKFSLAATYIDINEVKSTATLLGWMKLLWHDNKLRWNASDYGGVDVIHISPDEIWKPDLELYNVADKPARVGSHVNMLVYTDGTVLWVPPIRFDVYCKLNLKSWPRDSQTCTFVIGSWTHHNMILNLSFDNEGYDSEPSLLTAGTSRWKISEVQTERQVKFYNCCAEPYSSLHYEITVERRGGGHVILNEAPVIALMILLIAAALREPASRGTFLVAVALISSIYLVSLNLRFPSLLENPPRIAVFYSGLLSLAAVWGATSAVADWLSKSNERPVPGPLRRFVKKSKLNIASEEEGVAMSAENDKAAAALDENWSKLAVLFDRTFLIIGALGLVLIFLLNI